ncbi:hypothetical protein P1X14_04025 [Sphingomonas sp. AOB5]|uniref:hypothetical protein n=1 Tax=Sphingomonas sp. AOB5 TaxID=3034017 RepID=UPI0023F9DF7B|nr:hypothetical protein [Sphingomonas sp. AOB5]MDF7774404.1 hypothetical protein [Sphingomonas sp. AOB5]
MRVVLGRVGLGLGGALLLASCGGSGTTGTNYSDPPPMAEIVATPTPAPSPSASPSSAPSNASNEDTMVETNTM